MGRLKQSYRMAHSLLFHAQTDPKICIPAGNLCLAFFVGIHLSFDNSLAHRELSDDQSCPLQSCGLVKIWITATDIKIPKRIPTHFYKDILSKNDLVIVTLEHIDYLLKLKNQKNPYGFAAYTLSKLKEPIEVLSSAELSKLNGVGPVTVKIINEILETGKSTYYERLLYTSNI